MIRQGYLQRVARKTKRNKELKWKKGERTWTGKCKTFPEDLSPKRRVSGKQAELHGVNEKKKSMGKKGILSKKGPSGMGAGETKKTKKWHKGARENRFEGNLQKRSYEQKQSIWLFKEH